MSEKIVQMKKDWALKFPKIDFPKTLEAFIATEAAWSKLVEGRVLNSQMDHPLLSYDYLNEQNKKDPDIMANVKAIRETAEHFLFVAEYNHDVLGYWKCPLRGWLSLWVFDTEGQYRIASGSTFPETYIHEAILNDDDFLVKELLDIFGNAGVSVPSLSKEEIFANMDKAPRRAVVSPTANSHTLYSYFLKSQKDENTQEAPSPEKKGFSLRKMLGLD